MALNHTEEGKQYQLVPSIALEQGDAFDYLTQGNIDIFISAADKNRESSSLPIFVPTDRGLLGFRLCFTQKSNPIFEQIRSVDAMIKLDFSFGVGSDWPDLGIYQQNAIKTVSDKINSNLTAMIIDEKFDCYSRSVYEIDEELHLYEGTDIIVDENLLFIYPNAEFIYINPHKSEVHAILLQGIDAMLKDDTYFTYFDDNYADVLRNHGIYDRKLIFLENNQLSEQAIDAVNRFGVATFIQN